LSHTDPNQLLGEADGARALRRKGKRVSSRE
jgi:hypothetical protein